MVAATSTAGPVHVNVTIRAGSRTVTYSDDSLPASGRQVITISNGGHAVVLVLNEIGYVRANSGALKTFFGLPAALAARFAGRWISFKHGQPGYQSVTAGVTVPEVISELRLRPPLSTLPAAANGGSLVRIRGIAPAAEGAPAGATAIIDVTGAGRVLPVSMQISFGNDRSVMTFSDWGETVHVKAPINPVPISSVLQSGPSVA